MPSAEPSGRGAAATPHSAADPAGEFGKPDGGLRQRFYAVIFESDTRAGHLFDLGLIAAILLSVTVVVLTSVAQVAQHYGAELTALEWLFTLLFTVEYIARLCSVRHPWRYAGSFFGVIDLLAILPTIIALVVPGALVLLDVRILRLLRMFRILKLTSYVEEYGVLGRALLASRRKILIFLSVVMIIVFLLGTVMYAVEGPVHGFTSIPTAVYWAVSTVTTVGFGDITPKTGAGRTISSLIMLLGWGILAVPTGIISSEMTAQRYAGRPGRRVCGACGSKGHEAGAGYCKDCGAALAEGQE
ncbi:MAG TPA: ion transporter [Janthinobacterium sp.]|jgi:voltage-gated potassium channel|nr:ion transporter [Janthinobacterium sp.]